MREKYVVQLTVHGEVMMCEGVVTRWVSQLRRIGTKETRGTKDHKQRDRPRGKRMAHSEQRVRWKTPVVERGHLNV